MWSWPDGSTPCWVEAAGGARRGIADRLAAGVSTCCALAHSGQPSPGERRCKQQHATPKGFREREQIASPTTRGPSWSEGGSEQTTASSPPQPAESRGAIRASWHMARVIQNFPSRPGAGRSSDWSRRLRQQRSPAEPSAGSNAADAALPENSAWTPSGRFLHPEGSPDRICGHRSVAIPTVEKLNADRHQGPGGDGLNDQRGPTARGVQQPGNRFRLRRRLGLCGAMIGIMCPRFKSRELGEDRWDQP